MSNQDEKLLNFMQITGCDCKDAEFYLNASEWNIEAAMSSYFSEEPETANSSQPELESAIGSSNVNPQSEVNKSVNKSNSGNVHTFSSIRHDDEDEEEKGQTFYVGGSERGGGQQVIGPPRENKQKHQNADDFFKSAQEHGAEIVHSTESTSGASRIPFAGSGFRLGDDVQIGKSQQSKKSVDSKVQKVKVILWRNGFSVDDGPLRTLNDEDGREFFHLLSLGQIPPELLEKYKFSKIELDMVNKSDEDYTVTKPKLVPFEGTGRMLGSPQAIISNELNTTTLKEKLPSPIQIDETQPTTQLQIRLADNRREVLRLNHSHTVGDIHGHITSQYPEYMGRPFNLMTTFPNKVLSDLQMSVKDANILAAQIVQRLS